MRSVIAENLHRESHLVFDALSARMARRPQLEVLDAIVRLRSVAVVNGFIRSQGAPEEVLHEQTVLTESHLPSSDMTNEDNVPILDCSRSARAPRLRAESPVAPKLGVMRVAKPTRFVGGMAPFDVADRPALISKDMRSERAS